MKWCHVVILFFFLCVQSWNISIQAEESAPLWDRAVSLAGMNEHWIPGLMHSRMDELGKDSSVKNTVETWTKVTPGAADEHEYEIVKVIENGVDQTAEAKSQQKKTSSESDDEKEVSVSIGIANPFLNDPQSQLTVNRSGKDKVIAQKKCLAYDFVQKLETGTTITGTAYLEEETGIPLEINYASTPLPRFTKEMDITILYKYVSPEEWYPQKMIITATGGILFFTKRIRNRVVFSEYWQQDQVESK